MGDDGRIHVEAGIEDPGDDWRRLGGASSSRRLSRGRSPWRLAVVAAAAVALAAGGLVAVLGDGGDERDPEPEEPAPPNALWARATMRLGEAGSFAYRGTVRAAGPSALRPGEWLAAPVTVEGAVLLPQSITHEVAVDGHGRAVETVTSGPTAWSRTAPSRERLATASWRLARAAEPIPVGWLARTDETAPPRLGMALMVDALRATTNRRMDPPDGSGRRVLRATVPADARGPRIDAVPEEAEVSLALDGYGDIQRVELATAPGEDGWLVVQLTLDRVGEHRLVTAADVGEPARRTVPLDVLTAAGLQPVELGRLPAGWALTDARAWAGGEPRDLRRPTCPSLHLEYQELGAVGRGQLSLSVTSARCGATKGRADWGEPFRAGSFSGTVNGESSRTAGTLSDGVTTVDFHTDLSADTAAELLASLRPFDPARDPA